MTQNIEHEPPARELLARMTPEDQRLFLARDEELKLKARKLFAGRTHRVDHSAQEGRPRPGEFSLRAFDFEHQILFEEQY